MFRLDVVIGTRWLHADGSRKHEIDLRSHSILMDILAQLHSQFDTFCSAERDSRRGSVECEQGQRIVFLDIGVWCHPSRSSSFGNGLVRVLASHLYS
jgi:hypothetical protein